MTTLLALIAALWFAVSLIAAGVIGRGIHIADQRQVHPKPERVLRLIQGGAR